jgi:hypothetical protein
MGSEPWGPQIHTDREIKRQDQDILTQIIEDDLGGQAGLSEAQRQTRPASRGLQGPVHFCAAFKAQRQAGSVVHFASAIYNFMVRRLPAIKPCVGPDLPGERPERGPCLGQCLCGFSNECCSRIRGRFAMSFLRVSNHGNTSVSRKRNRASASMVAGASSSSSSSAGQHVLSV